MIRSLTSNSVPPDVEGLLKLAHTLEHDGKLLLCAKAYDAALTLQYHAAKQTIQQHTKELESAISQATFQAMNASTASPPGSPLARAASTTFNAAGSPKGGATSPKRRDGSPSAAKNPPASSSVSFTPPPPPSSSPTLHKKLEHHEGEIAVTERRFGFAVEAQIMRFNQFAVRCFENNSFDEARDFLDMTKRYLVVHPAMPAAPPPTAASSGSAKDGKPGGGLAHSASMSSKAMLQQLQQQVAAQQQQQQQQAAAAASSSATSSPTAAAAAAAGAGNHHTTTSSSSGGQQASSPTVTISLPTPSSQQPQQFSKSGGSQTTTGDAALDTGLVYEYGADSKAAIASGKMAHASSSSAFSAAAGGATDYSNELDGPEALALVGTQRNLWMLTSDQSCRLRCLTLNNYGCLARRKKEFAVAQSMFRASLDVAKSGGATAPAAMINLSALLSQQGLFSAAAEVARRVIRILERSRQQHLNDSSSSTVLSGSKKLRSGGGGEEPLALSLSKSGMDAAQGATAGSHQAGLLGVAFNCLAIALEPVDSPSTVEAYKTSLRLLKEDLGIESPTYRAVLRSYEKYTELVTNIAAVNRRASTLSPMEGAVPNLIQSTAAERRRSSLRPPPQGSGAAGGGGGRRNRSPSTTFSTPAAAGGGNQQAAVSQQASPSAPASITIPAGVQEGLKANGVPSVLLTTHGMGGAADDTTAPGVGADGVAAVLVDTETVTQHLPPQTLSGGKGTGELAVPLPLALAPAPPTQAKSNPAPGSRRGRGSTSSNAASDKSGAASTSSPRTSPTAPPLLAAGGPSGGVPSLIAKPPPKSLPPLSLETFGDEVKRRDDLVQFLSNRLGQLLRLEEHHHVRYLAALRIQRAVRPWLAHRAVLKMRALMARQLLEKKLRANRASRIITRFFKFSLEEIRRNKFARDAVLAAQRRRREAIICFQKYTRRWNAVQQVARLRRWQEIEGQSALILQRWIRSCLARIKHKRLREVRRIATEQLVEWEMRNRSAAVLQSSYRQHRDYLKYLRRTGKSQLALFLDKQRYRTLAAIMVQRWVRGHFVRLRTHAVLGPKRQRIRNQHRSLRSHAAAVRIQAVFRGFRVRLRWATRVAAARSKGLQQYHQQLHEKCTAAAIKIQSWVRMVLQRRKHLFATRREAEGEEYDGGVSKKKQLGSILPSGKYHPLVNLDYENDEEQYFLRPSKK